jgi:hypothetical protein
MTVRRDNNRSTKLKRAIDEAVAYIKPRGIERCIDYLYTFFKTNKPREAIPQLMMDIDYYQTDYKELHRKLNIPPNWDENVVQSRAFINDKIQKLEIQLEGLKEQHKFLDTYEQLYILNRMKQAGQSVK